MFGAKWVRLGRRDLHLFSSCPPQQSYSHPSSILSARSTACGDSTANAAHWRPFCLPPSFAVCTRRMNAFALFGCVLSQKLPLTIDTLSFPLLPSSFTLPRQAGRKVSMMSNAVMTIQSIAERRQAVLGNWDQFKQVRSKHHTRILSFISFILPHSHSHISRLTFSAFAIG